MSQYIAVSDAFSHQFLGGAELTTDALLNPRANVVTKINSSAITEEFVDQNLDKTWIIFNFSALDDRVKINLAKKVKYSIVEYDYKICKHRSLDLHRVIEKEECDCINEGMEGKIKQLFYGYAQKIWFMSEAQRQIFLDKVTSIKKERTEVLSSVFLEGDLRFIQSISDNNKNSKFIILNSNSWIKGTKDSILYAKQNNLDFELVKGLRYHELLIKLSTSKGLIFRPLGGDTCPRIVIEAKLLGCELLMNENVQHKDEPWFENKDTIKKYLNERVETFWSFYEK